MSSIQFAYLSGLSLGAYLGASIVFFVIWKLGMLNKEEKVVK